MMLDKSKIRFKASRSGGPGGERVNRRSTKVEVWVSVKSLPVSEKGRKTIREKLASHLNQKDEIWVENQETRSQEMNRDLALERLNAMLRGALKTPKPRIPTEPRRSVKERRLKEKKIRSERKKSRRGTL